MLGACSATQPPPPAQAPQGLPCPGTAPHVYQACGCNPVESRLLTRAGTLEASIQTATRDCLSATGQLNVLAVDGGLEACVSRTQALDPTLSDALGRLVVESNGDVSEAERDQWLSCYERAVVDFQSGAAETGRAACRSDAGLGALSDADGASIERRELSVRTLAIREGRTVALCPGDTVRSGEYMVLELRPRTDGYVHVAAISPDRQGQILYPEQGESQRLRGGVPMRIPTLASQAFQLDDTTGTETLLVVVSKRPLAESDRGAAEVFDHLRKSGHLPPDVVIESPDGATRRGGRAVPSRGLHRVDIGVQAVYSQFDREGVIIVPITFQHVD